LLQYSNSPAKLGGLSVGGMLGLVNKNITLTITSFIFFAVAVVHIARVILGSELVIFEINIPNVLSILVALVLSFLGWKLLNYRD